MSIRIDQYGSLSTLTGGLADSTGEYNIPHWKVYKQTVAHAYFYILPVVLGFDITRRNQLQCSCSGDRNGFQTEI